jgi:hypothetical protein
MAFFSAIPQGADRIQAHGRTVTQELEFAAVELKVDYW